MSPSTTPAILKSIGITVACGLAFIVMASVFSPQRTQAGEDDSPRASSRRAASQAQATLSTNAHEDLRSLGVIESGRHTIVIFATDLGPRYTVIENANQQEIGTLLRAEQVKQLLPEIDIRSLDFSAASSSAEQQLMIAEPRDGGV